MLPNDFWKVIMRGGINQFFDKPWDNSGSNERTKLLVSIDEPINEIAMNLDTQKRTGYQEK